MFLNVPALIGAVFLFSELALGFYRRSSRQSGSRSADQGSLGLIWVVIFVALSVGFYVVRRGVGPRICAPSMWGWLAAVGVVVFAGGAFLRWWSIWRLGRFFTVDVALAEDHRIIDDGPYRRIRHPSYLGALLEFAGMLLTCNNWLALPIVLGPILVVFLRRIQVEEQALLSRLGEAYARYMQHTGRLLPRLGGGEN